MPSNSSLAPRLPEAAFFARTYLPSEISRVVGLWRESLAKTNKKASEALADPTEYENLFPGLRENFQVKSRIVGSARPLA